MKITLRDYVHGSNFMKLVIEPESPIERELLAAFWAHGKMEVTYSGYQISWDNTRDRASLSAENDRERP